MGRLPDRWLDYRPIGACIPGTRFIAFKAPLNAALNCKADPPSRLDCQKLIRKLPGLGMVVDLTNTKRFYQPDDLIQNGIIHYKLMVPGHETPKAHLFREFVDCVNAFLHDNQDNSKLIGVHCTHGVNRTGYFICKYMVTQLNFQPTEALRLFSNARGHKIERNNYVADIQRTRMQQLNNPNGRSEDEQALAPQVTSWRHSFDRTSYDGQNGGMRHRAAPNAGPSRQAGRQQRQKPQPFHMDANGWYVMGDNNGGQAMGAGMPDNRNRRMPPASQNWRDRGDNQNMAQNQPKPNIPSGGDGAQQNWQANSYRAHRDQHRSLHSNRNTNDTSNEFATNLNNWRDSQLRRPDGARTWASKRI